MSRYGVLREALRGLTLPLCIDLDMSTSFPGLHFGVRRSGLTTPDQVQTPIQYQGRETLEYGDPVFLRHAKAGELCERFNTLLLVAGGDVVGEVPTYRGQGFSFL